MLSTIAVFTAAAIAVVSPAHSFNQPDLSGSWTLDLAASQFGDMPPTPQRTDLFVHRGDSLLITRTMQGPQGPITSTLRYRIDGKPHKNTVSQVTLTSSLKWDGAALLIETEANGPQGTYQVSDRYTLSDDRQTLTIRRVLKVEGEEMPQTQVLRRS